VGENADMRFAVLAIGLDEAVIGAAMGFVTL
jgi:hypothetical protein